MTANKARKRQIRAEAAASGRSYTATLRRHTATGVPGLADLLGGNDGYGTLAGTREQWSELMTLVAGSAKLSFVAGLALGSAYLPTLGRPGFVVHMTGLADKDRPVTALALAAGLFGDPARLTGSWLDIPSGGELARGQMPLFLGGLAGVALRKPRLDRAVTGFLNPAAPHGAVVFSAGQKPFPARLADEGELAHRILEVPWPTPPRYKESIVEKLVAQCFGHAVQALAERGPAPAVFGSDVERIRGELTGRSQGAVAELAYSLAIGAAGARLLARLAGVDELAGHGETVAEELFVRRHKRLAGVQRLPQPTSTPWERLTGLVATIGEHRGLVLGPADPATPALLRLDREDSGGGVLTVDASTREVDPLPFEVSIPERGHSGSRCPRKRPVYTYGNIPAGLATESMLHNLRRKLAEGQTPIATYLNHVRHAETWVPLYAVADTESLPELPPGRAAAWQAARTCCECGTTRERPIPKGPSGERACRDCAETVAERWWHQRRVIERAEAQQWAAEVLADAQAVLVYEERYHGSAELCVATTGGQILIDTTVRDNLDQVNWFFDRDGKTAEQLRAEFLAQHTEPGDPGLFAAVHALGGRRLVAWSRSYDGLVLGSYEWRSLTEGVTLAVAAADDFTAQCTRWVGERASAAHVRWGSNPELKRHPQWTPTPRRDRIELMRNMLARMASDQDPRGAITPLG